MKNKLGMIKVICLNDFLVMKSIKGYFEKIEFIKNNIYSYSEITYYFGGKSTEKRGIYSENGLKNFCSIEAERFNKNFTDLGKILEDVDKAYEKTLKENE